MRIRTLVLSLALLAGGVLPALAQDTELNASVHEVVIQIPKPGLISLDRETTVDNCAKHAKSPCKLYPVDEFVVWAGGAP